MPLGITISEDAPGGVSSIITTPGVKGERFKSSPLSPAKRDIADGIKRNMGISDGTREDD